MATPSMTSTDVLWTVVLLAVLIVCGFGLMFIAAAYITPTVLGSPNSVPRHGYAAVAEFGIMFGGLIAGDIVGLAILGVVTRRLLPASVHRRWAAQFVNGKEKMPPLLYGFGTLIVRVLRPRND